MRSHDSGRTLLMVLLFKFGKTFFIQSTGLVTFVKTKAIRKYFWITWFCGWVVGGGGGVISPITEMLYQETLTMILLVV